LLDKRRIAQVFPKRDLANMSPTIMSRRANTAIEPVESVGMPTEFPPPPPIAVAVGVTTEVRVGAGVGVGVAVVDTGGVRVGVLVAVSVGVVVLVAVAVGVGVLVDVSVGVGVLVSVGVGVLVAVSVGVGVLVAVSVGVLVCAKTWPLRPAKITAMRTSRIPSLAEIITPPISWAETTTGTRLFA